MLNRRQFVVSAALAGPFAGLVANPLLAKGNGRRRRRPSDYGPLRTAVDETTGESFLRLPEGFRYRSIAPAGSRRCVPVR